MPGIMDSEDRVRFREQCAEILEKLGKDRHNGHSRFYQDDKIMIQRGWNQKELEITILPAAHPDGLTNPCVMVTDGECIRHHGEWVYLKEHVENIHSKL